MSKIWIPKFKIVEPKRELELPVTMRGQFKIRIRKRDGVTVRHETPWFDNLILNNGLDAIASGSREFATVAVGSGNSAPAEGQSQLDSLVASVAATQDSGSLASSSPYSVSKTMVGSFGQGAAAGNLAEVGIGPGQADLFSRALIVDGAGNPTTLTIQADEFLDVFYQCTLNIPETDVTGTIDISGTSHDYTLRAALVTNGTWWAAGASSGADQTTWMRNGFAETGFTQICKGFDGAIGAITSSPGGNQDDPGSRSQAGSYTSGDYQQDCEAQWGLDEGNFATGLRSVQATFGAWGDDARNTFQIEYDPVIDKSDTEVLTLQFRHIWGRDLAST